MRERSAAVPLLLLLVLMATLFYPALFLDNVVGPEAGMRDVPPWRGAWGPYPRPTAPAVQAATRLGPRLAVMAREGSAAAVWNRWIGGGRAGWLGSAEEGGSPLALIAASAARTPYTWTALVALQAGAALLLCWWALRRLGRTAWAAAAGAVAYTLSGVVTAHWLDWKGSAFALGPLALVVALSPRAGSRRWFARAGLAGVLLLLCGTPALQFLLLAAVVAVVARGVRPVAPGRQIAAAVATAAAAAAAILPRAWLWVASAEPGARLLPSSPAPGVAGLGALLASSPSAVEDLAGRALRGVAAASTPDGSVGAVALILVLIGLAGGHLRHRLLWGGVLAATVALAIVPLPDGLPLPFRPLGAMAVVVAALVAAGVDALGSRAGRPAAVGAVAALLLFFDLFPAAAHKLPFAGPSQERLPRPFTAEILARGARVVALGATLPPDLGATLELADVRASSLHREPRYDALLSPTDQGTIGLGRVLDPVLPRLGARYLIEPLPLRVVSGILFSRASFASALPLRERGRWALEVEVPSGATRIALPSQGGLTGPPSLRLASGAVRPLEADGALANESDDWTWYAIPESWPPGRAFLEALQTRPQTRQVPILWDTSGMRLHAEIQGARIWRSDRARPAAFLATSVTGEDRPPPDRAGPGGVQVADPSLAADAEPAVAGDVLRAVAMYGDRLELEVQAGGPRLVVAQVKFRPFLWRARVDGKDAPTVAVDGVWTGIPLPRGATRVSLTAVVPLWTWAVGLTALAVLFTLAVMGEKR